MFYPETKQDKYNEKIFFDNLFAIPNDRFDYFLELYNNFYDDHKSEYLKYFLFIINIFFMFIQLFNFYYFNFNILLLTFHLIFLIYTEIVLLRIKRQKKFLEYYMNAMYRYLKYRNYNNNFFLNN